jgi:hypothetical protein
VERPADPEPVDDQAAGDAGGPGGEVVLGRELVAVLVGAQQRLLHQLLGLVRSPSRRTA